MCTVTNGVLSLLITINIMDNANRRSSGQDEGIFSNNTFLAIIWVFAFLIFLCIPLCSSKYRRTLWCRRLLQRRWDVELPEPDQDPEWYRIAVHRYEAYRARAEQGQSYELTREQEEEVRQLFLFECMASFTTTLGENDIVEKKPQEKSEDDVTVNSSSESHSGDQTASDSSERDIEMGRDMNAEEDHDTNDSGIDWLQEIEESSYFVRVPVPGRSLSSDSINSETRLVPSGCAICLSEYEAGDRIIWSATADDPHVFHEDCMFKYLVSVGRKASRQRRGQEDRGPNQDPMTVATDFPTLCPCCRQQFLCLKEKRIRSDTGVTEDDSDNSHPGAAIACV